MNNNVNKYFALMALLMGGFVSLILFLVLFFYVLKLLSLTFFSIPGTENVFHVVIILVPYIVYYASYYYLQKKIAKATTLVSKTLGWFFLIAGIIVCTITLTMAFMVFFKMNYPWLRVFEANSHYAFIVQIIFVFATSMVIASGDKKETDWMERG